MKRIIYALVIITLVFSVNGQVPVNASSLEEKKVLVVFDEGLDEQEVADTVESAGGDLLENYEEVGMASIQANGSSVEELAENPAVKHMEEDIVVKLKAQQEDWGISYTNIPAAWGSGFTGKGIKVAVIDSGIAPHRDLTIAGGISTVAYTQSYSDDQGHGTHVAGIIGARNNTIGVKGVAYESELYAVKAFDQNGSAYLSDIIEGIDWSIANGMEIINLSAGTQTDSWSFRSAVDKAYANGLLVVAAAGNDASADGSGDTVDFPARYPSAIAVGAVDKNAARAAFSSTGPAVEVAAPGVGIVSTYLGDNYAGMSGTSMAAPYVAGELALLKQAYPQLTNEELRSVLIELTRDLGPAGRDPFFGYGLIQATSFTIPQEAEPANPLANLTVSETSITGAPEEIVGVSAVAVYENGDTRNVTNEAVWSSADTTVATVGANGSIQLKGYGSTFVTVTYEGESAVIAVEVPEPNPVVLLETDQTSVTGSIGESVSINAVAVHKNGSKENVTGQATWSSSDTTVATVANGKVLLKGYGSATITVQYEGLSAVIAVNVPEENSVVNLETDRNSVSGALGGTISVKASAAFNNGDSQDVTAEAIWSSADSSIATVDDGVIQLKGYGSTTITVSYEGQSVIIAVNVPEPASNPLEQLKVDNSMVIGQPGEIISITATAHYTNGEVRDVTREASWSSADPEVATAASGKIEIRGYGSTAVRLSFEGESIVIVVNSPEPQPQPATFNDISIDHWAYTEINYLKEQNIITGYQDNTFRASETIRRDHVALLFSKILPLENTTEQVQFSDVPKSYWYYEEIMKTQRAGIFSGSNGKFRPTDDLTRAQMAKILVESFDLQGQAEHPFTDVSKGHWANDYIGILYTNGITTGSAGLYKPEDTVTRAQYAVFLYRALTME